MSRVGHVTCSEHRRYSPLYKETAFDVCAPTPSSPSSMSGTTPTKNVVVLGGGGAGVTVAQTLSKKLNHAQYNLVLIDMRPHMIWLPAGARMVVTHDEAFTDTVRFLSISARSEVGTLRPIGRVPVREGLLTGKGNFQAGTSPSYNFPSVVTGKQGTVVAINEAKDQHGGQLEFDSGETLNYEGGSSMPHASSVHPIHPKPI